MKAVGTKNKSRGLRSIMVAMPREGNLDIDSITCKMCMSVCFFAFAYSWDSINFWSHYFEFDLNRKVLATINVNRAGNTGWVCLQCQSQGLRVDEHLQKNQYAKGRWLLLKHRRRLFWLILQCQSQGQASSKVKRGEFLFIQNVKREKLFVVLQCHAHKFY